VSSRSFSRSPRDFARRGGGGGGGAAQLISGEVGCAVLSTGRNHCGWRRRRENRGHLPPTDI